MSSYTEECMKILLLEILDNEILFEQYISGLFVSTGLLALYNETDPIKLHDSLSSLMSEINNVIKNQHNSFIQSNFTATNKDNNIPPHSIVSEKGLIDLKVLKHHETPSKTNTIYILSTEINDVQSIKDYLKNFDVVTLIGEPFKNYQQNIPSFAAEYQSYKFIYGKKIDSEVWKYLPFINIFSNGGFRTENKDLYKMKTVDEFSRGAYNIVNIHNFIDELREMCNLGTKYGS